jgi:4-aminobutyrate aminotransferase-like enzyme
MPTQLEPNEPIPESVVAGDLIYRRLPAPRFVEASGTLLRDSLGRSYMDAEAANGTVGLGYDASVLHEAVARAAALPALPSFCESDLRLKVIDRIATRLNRATGLKGRVSIELGGAQAIETAMRIVAANRGNGPIIVFEGGYHGRSALTAHLSASSRYREVQPWPGPEIIRLPYPDCASCPHAPGRSGCNPACAAAVERIGRDDTSGLPGASSERGVGALVIEPLLNVGGAVLPDSELVRRTVDHVRTLGGLIVVDEIFTGLHRLGPEWGHQLHGIVPDIVVASKALTNGATAFSCVWAREPLADPGTVRPGSHSSTYAGNPLALAVVDTVLDRWEAIDAEGTISRLTTALEDAMRAAARHEIVAETTVVGGLARLRFAGPYASSVREAATRCDAGHGLLVASTGMAPTVVSLHPPLTTGATDIRLMGELLDNAVSRVEQAL